MESLGALTKPCSSWSEDSKNLKKETKKMFKPAERKQSKLKIAITGPSGSGKTYSSLVLASGLTDKIALIDTEHGSATKHVGKPGIPPFLVDEIKSFEPEFYIRSIKEAIANKMELVIIDSLSHEWSATKKIAEDSQKGGNSWSGWATATPRHQALIETILQSPIHVICTMRSKTEWIVDKDANTGKSKPVKVGLAPDQRQNIEYEYDTIFSINEDHVASTEKDRTDLFANFSGVLTAEHGKKFKEWLESGSTNPDVMRPSEEQRKYVFALLKELNLDYNEQAVKNRLREITTKESMTFWSQTDVATVTKTLQEAIRTQTKHIKTAT
jgi:hypothetical protein